MKILYVEDNPVDARIMRHMLRGAEKEWGRDLVVADRLASAFTLLNTHTFDFVFVDLNLPDSRGLDTLRKILDQKLNMPVVVMTGIDEVEIGLTAMKLGAQDYLIKGKLNPSALARVIRYAIERKKIEEALRESEQKYRAFLKSANDVVFIHALDENYQPGLFLEVNKEACRRYGYTKDEFLRMTPHDINDPLSFAHHIPFTLENLRKNGRATFESVHVGKNGRRFSVEVNSQIIHIKAVPHVISIVRDITARKRAEEKIQKYASDLELLLNISRGMVSTTDLRKLYRFAVLAAQELLGLDFSTLMIMSEDGEKLIIADTIGFPEAMIGQFSLLKGQGLATLVAQSKKPDIVLDFNREDRFYVPELIKKNKISSAICVPMMLEEDLFGVLVGHTIKAREFSHENISLYQSIGNQAAIAVKNAMNLEKMMKGEKKLHDITSHLAEGLYVMDLTGHVTFLNEEAVRLLGWSMEDLNKKGVHDLVHSKKADGSPLPFELCGMHNVINTGKTHISTDEVFVRKDGSAFPVSVVASPILDNGRTVAVVTSFRDISERKKIEQDRERLIGQLRKAEAQLRHLSRTDGLTGIANRRAFDEFLEDEWKRALRKHYPLAVMLIDVDFFKKFNDTYGHIKGDEALKAVAAVLRGNARRTGDITARFGGEEFVVVLSSLLDPLKAVACAEKICAEVEALKLPHAGSNISDYLTVSVGVFTDVPNKNMPPTDFIKFADGALYKAKSEGRNRVVPHLS